MIQFATPFLLYLGVAVGALGVALALPRRGLSPQVVGGMVAGVGLGLSLLALGLKAGEHGPGIYFYLFSFIGLGAALRMISHPRPVYAALYFVLTILSSAGLYLLLSAEFMAFALVIIYAGAILITYLFVIMLATQAPTAEEIDVLSEYDRYSRDPIISTVAGFALLAVLTAMLVGGLEQPLHRAGPSESVSSAVLSRKVEPILERTYGLPPEARLVRVQGTSATVEFPNGWGGSDMLQIFRPLEPGETMQFDLPADAAAENIEQIGLTLVGGHPLGLEVAGVILLMAMLGAIILARKQIQEEEGRKVAAARGGLTSEARP